MSAAFMFKAMFFSHDSSRLPDRPGLLCAIVALADCLCALSHASKPPLYSEELAAIASAPTPKDVCMSGVWSACAAAAVKAMIEIRQRIRCYYDSILCGVHLE